MTFFGFFRQNCRGSWYLIMPKKSRTVFFFRFVRNGPKTCANGNAKFPLKVWISKLPLQFFSEQAYFVWARFFKPKFQTVGKPEKNNSGADVGPRTAFKTKPGGWMFSSKRRDSESSTDIGRQKRLRNQLWMGCCLHIMTVMCGGRGPGVWWKYIGRWCAPNTWQNFSVRLERQKTVSFQVWEETVGRRRKALVPY